jgi:hypothetical protein
VDLGWVECTGRPVGGGNLVKILEFFKGMAHATHEPACMEVTASELDVLLGIATAATLELEGTDVGGCHIPLSPSPL